MAIIITPPSGFDINLSLWTNKSVLVASSDITGSSPETITYTATYSGKWFMQVNYLSGSGQGRYTISVIINGQNDANSGTDAGNTYADALTLTPGSYYGFLDMNDPYDWYKFQVDAGKGIHLKLVMRYLVSNSSDFDLQLYNPSGKLVYEGNQYFDDELLYPANVAGEWKVRVDIFPGWVDCSHPTEWKYYSYGSGAYNLILAIESSAPIPGTVPQPQITPIAKTFKIVNDPNNILNTRNRGQVFHEVIEVSNRLGEVRECYFARDDNGNGIMCSCHASPPPVPLQF